MMKLVRGGAVGPGCAVARGVLVPSLGGPGCVFGAWLEQHRRGAHGRLCSCLATPKPGLEASEAGDGGVRAQPPHCPGGASSFLGCPGSPGQPQRPGEVRGQQQRLQGAPSAVKVAGTAGLGGEHPKCAGQMLLGGGKGPPDPKNWSALLCVESAAGTAPPGFCGCSEGRSVPAFLTIFILAVLILTLLQDQVLSRSRRFFSPHANQPGGQNLPPASPWVAYP